MKPAEETNGPGTVPFVEVIDLVVHYGSRQVSSLPRLTLDPGECVAIVGESGSGKTTSLLAMLGLVGASSASVSGSVRIGSVDVLTSSEAEVRKIRGSVVALVMQSPQGALNPTMRLGTLIKRALALHGIRKDEARRRIEDALESVRLEFGILRRRPHEISGGQAQRFAIAMAVALGARVIAADEPTSALDVTVQAEVLALLDRLRRDRGIAVLLVSHDLALVALVADTVIVMQDGEVVESGPADVVLSTPSADYTRALLAAVPVMEAP